MDGTGVASPFVAGDERDQAPKERPPGAPHACWLHCPSPSDLRSLGVLGGWEELSPTRYFPWLGQPYLRKMGGRQKDSGGLGGTLVCLEMESV